jgi:murein DD-endopeptidase MepM/ murein hydrolase activator NlpD
MTRGGLAVAMALAALGVAACDREAPRTVVVPPGKSLPDDTVLRPQAGAPAPPQPAASTRAGSPGDRDGAQLLAQRALAVPVAGIPPTALSDNYEQRRGQGAHEAIDILAPSGTPVVAVDDGRIAKLFTSQPGGLTIYQYDPAQRLAYYYAHLQRYADGVREGQDVKRGQLIAYVGSSGNADPKAPHLHFAVFKLGAPPRWWEGEPVNPYPALSQAAPTEQVANR